jgi:hypothetical protein
MRATIRPQNAEGYPDENKTDMVDLTTLFVDALA